MSGTTIGASTILAFVVIFALAMITTTARQRGETPNRCAYCNARLKFAGAASRDVRLLRT